VRVRRVHAVPVRGGFFTDDQAAVRSGRGRDGFTYTGPPLTPGFRTVRQPTQAVSVLLELDDGQLAHGDCVAVQYAAAGGRDPVLVAQDAARAVREVVGPLLVGREAGSFRELAGLVEDVRAAGEPLHTAVRYGVTQAVLDAVARTQRLTMAEVLRDEYDTGAPLEPVGVFAQCGDERYDNVDKMILLGAGALPHGLVNDLSKVGPDGAALTAYVRWVRDRVLALRTDPQYLPVLHLDVYGTVGLAFDGDLDRVADHLIGLAAVAAPLPLRVEHPVDAGGREAQIEAMALLRGAVAARGGGVALAVDEWCNTLDDVAAFVAAGAADVVHVKVPDLGGLQHAVEALLLVREAGLLAYCGGSATETERSAQVTAHVAMACGADQVLAKPGMGVDEGMMVVGNEMARVHALVQARAAGRG
jgi:methylaspartate ammonia-lyase